MGGGGWSLDDQRHHTVVWEDKPEYAYTGKIFITVLLLDCLINWLISSVSWLLFN